MSPLGRERTGSQRGHHGRDKVDGCCVEEIVEQLQSQRVSVLPRGVVVEGSV